jgi:hypothetical protein
MSDRDSFIDEVSEEVRRDRLFGLLRRYGWIAVLVVVALVGVAVWVEWQRIGARSEARDFGDRLVAALNRDAPEARRAALAEIDASGARRALVAMVAADTLETDAVVRDTLDNLAAVAGDDAVPQLYRDLAGLKAAMLMQDRAEPRAVLDRLEPLTIPGAPFRLLALEQQALVRVRQGETDAALETLRGILEDGAAGRDLQQRARQLIVALGGSLDTAEG